MSLSQYHEPFCGGRAGDLHVLLERRLVGDREVERHDDGHADPDGLALQRSDRGVGLLVERQVAVWNAAGALDRLTVGAGRRRGDPVVGARLEQGRGGPGAALDPARRRGPAADVDAYVGQVAAVGRRRSPELSIGTGPGSVKLVVSRRARPARPARHPGRRWEASGDGASDVAAAAMHAARPAESSSSAAAAAVRRCAGRMDLQRASAHTTDLPW